MVSSAATAGYFYYVSIRGVNMVEHIKIMAILPGGEEHTMWCVTVLETTPRWYTIRKKLKSLTRFIDYGCNFRDGLCIRERKEHNTSERCCCGGCSLDSYFKYPEKVLTKEDALFFKKNYRLRMGFWRPTGCILPRELRPILCLGHRCYFLGSKHHKIPPEAIKLLNLISDLSESNYPSKELVDRAESAYWELLIYFTHGNVPQMYEIGEIPCMAGC